MRSIRTAAGSVTTRWLFVLSAIFLIPTSIIYAQTGEPAEDQTAQAPAAVNLAVINGRTIITSKEVDHLIGSELYKLQKQIYELRKNALNSLVTRVVLEEEAKRRGVTVELLKKSLAMTETSEISQARIDQVYAENQAAYTAFSEDEVKERIRLDLESQDRINSFRKALDEIRQRQKIAIGLTEPRPPRVKVGETGAWIGPADAPVTIVEFSDFQCPYCKRAAKTIKEIRKIYGDRVRIIYRHSPLPNHSEAFTAAQASVCAHHQGRFWDYHDRLFNSDDLSDETLKRIAVETGLNMNEFETCLGSEVSREVVQRDLQEARKIGVRGTPHFVINGQVIQGAQEMPAFKKIIDLELGKDK